MHAEFWHTHIGSERRIVSIFKTQPGIDPTLERVIPATQGGNTGQTVNQSLNQGAKMEMHRPVIHLKMMKHKV